MNEVKVLREFLGWAQKDMAAYLHISRTHLAMVERFDRQLSPKKYLRFMQLDRLRIETEMLEIPDEKKSLDFQEEKNKRFNVRKQLKEFRLNKLKEYHEKLQSEKIRARKLLEGLKHIKSYNIDIHDALLTHTKTNAEKILGASAGKKEIALEMQIELLENELEFLRKMKKEK